ncbi:hypothetical protein AB0H76_29875 [Nocardia sp. NPDC050712]|uniref:hypothetical protein n=1 Tax=Nocardia sp. NPDC050712 TaxID=3155518 RepID=UPI0034022D75
MYAGNCPVCGRNDQCQKVSAIHAAGTARARGYTYDHRRRRHTTTVSQTALAARLSPPVLHSDVTGAVRAVMMLALGLFAHLCVGAMIHDSGDALAAAVFAPLWLSVWFIVPSALVLTVNLLRSRRLNADLPRRRAIWQVWNTLYFCARDDVAFAPGGRPFHPSQLPGFMQTTTGPFTDLVRV